ncbi:MAG: CoA pyrophosphatase [Cyclobacteriaceae bacterium]
MGYFWSMPDSFIQQLQEQLRSPLPGSQAHGKMKARFDSQNGVRFKHEGEPQPGAVLVMFYKESGQWKFPLIQRPPYDGIHGGQIGLPGGKAEPEDSDLIQTALRETHEEIGVEPEKVEVIGSLSSFYVGASHYQILPVLGICHSVPSFVPDPKEVAEVIDAPIQDFLVPKASKEKEIEVRGVKLMAPYYDVRDKFIWGATAMMLSELVEIIQPIQHTLTQQSNE